jgi:hypothetical protein
VMLCNSYPSRRWCLRDGDLMVGAVLLRPGSVGTLRVPSPRRALYDATDPELGEAMAMPERTDGPAPDPDTRARPDAGGRAPGSQDELRRRLAGLPASHPSSPRYRAAQADVLRGWDGRERRSPESPAARPDEPGAGRSGAAGAGGRGASRGARSEQSRVNRAGQPVEGRDERAAVTVGGRRGERVDRGGQPAEGRDEAAAVTADGRRGERRGPGDQDDAGQDGRASGPREAAGGAAAVAARLIRGGRPRTPEQDAKDRRADDALWARAAALHAAAQARRRARGPGAPSRPPAPSYPPARREPFRPWFATSGEHELWLNAERTGDPWFARGDGERER